MSFGFERIVAENMLAQGREHGTRPGRFATEHTMARAKTPRPAESGRGVPPRITRALAKGQSSSAWA